MKISVDCPCPDKLFELNETQRKVICNDISDDIFDADMKRRLEYILMHKYERCFDRLKKEWESKLASAGAKSIPTDKDEFAQMVFKSPEYKNRKAREDESLSAELK